MKNFLGSSQLPRVTAAALPPSGALAPYLYMIYKSFILNLNLIDLDDLGMHPLLGVWGEEIVSGYWQSRLRGGRLTCQRSNQCQVGSEAS